MGTIISKLILSILHIGCVYWVLSGTTIDKQNLLPFACMFGLVTSYLSDIYIQLKKLNNKD